MSTYSQCGQDVQSLVDEVIKAHHPDLLNAEVKIDLLFAHAPQDKNGDPRGPAIKLHGYKCGAVVRKLGLKDRVAGRGDAEITFDGDAWGKMNVECQRALIDHELTHLVVLKDDDNHVKTDDCGRPRLEMKLHEIQVGWFLDVAKRHGMNSGEIQQAIKIKQEHGQLLFGFHPELSIVQSAQSAA